MAKNGSGGALVAASLILGASILGASWMLRSSLESTGESLVTALEAQEPAAPPARAAAARPGRPDPNRRYDVQTKGSPRKGAEKARVTVVEFSDFQCPFCSRVTPTLERIQETYGDDVAIVFKHLPLRMHAKAPAAHAAAEAAHRQGKFWEMHDLIFANQREMSTERYKEYAQQLGLDLKRFESDLASTSVRERVAEDASEAAKLGVTGTPAFFINGRFLSGAQPYESFADLIDKEMKKSG